jgi:phage tail-like protein
MPEAAPPPAPSGASGQFVDPYRNYNFKLEIQNITQGHFTECSSIGARIPALAYREAGNQQVVRRIPGPMEYADVVLRYGVTASDDLWRWFLAAAQGNVERKNVSIVLLDSAGTGEAMRWNLNRAWPKEWNGAALDARGKDVAIESITLVFETLERVRG